MATNGDRAWFGWPDFPSIQALRDKFAVTADPGELKTLAAEVQKQAIDEGVVVPNGQFVISPTAYSTKLTGILESPAALFWNVKKAP